MFTLEQLRQTENIVRNPPVSPRVTDIRGGVWSQAEIEAAIPGWPHVTIQHDPEVAFFTDDHLYGYPVLPRQFVAVSYKLPCFNMNGFEGPQDRNLETAADLIAAYFKDRRIIESAEELVEYLNRKYP